MKRNLPVLFFLISLIPCRMKAQTAWPSESWENAVNLTSVMEAVGVAELSGLHWNPVLNRLYISPGNGGLRVLQLDAGTDTFTQIANQTFTAGSEGVTQADYTTNEFYIIDENTYRIRRYMHTADFDSVTLVNSWNLLKPPSTMINTGNAGPEGIVFVPDSFLIDAGFVSAATGQPYTSMKGLGGLMFVASQAGGFIWVYDINPDSTDDFAFVGKYKTNSTESCDLAFDRSTGLLYILHNTSPNTLEVNDLTSALAGNERKLTTVKEYNISNPALGNDNIEGFAISPKCNDTTDVSVWLCRDVAGGDILFKFDCLRWFNPFGADGDCRNPVSSAGTPSGNDELNIYLNYQSNKLVINADEEIHSCVIFNSVGGIIENRMVHDLNLVINTGFLSEGIYYVLVQSAKADAIRKFIVVK